MTTEVLARHRVEATTRTAAMAAFHRVREQSVRMCASLQPEECRLQPLVEVSPPWWNLGHTSWFFVRNVLAPFGSRMTLEDEQYDYLLNSYYESLGARLPRSKRGSVSRPTTDEIFRYRQSVDERIETLVATCDDTQLEKLLPNFTIGIQHEQQHQELFYTEIKFILAQNPVELRRAYAEALDDTAPKGAPPLQFIPCDGGLLSFGNCEGGWCWDNELPVHRHFLLPFEMSNRLVTNAEFLEFVEDGGYTDPLLWLDNGWQQASEQRWHAPLYWEQRDGQWWNFTLSGMRRMNLAEPVCHVSFYEADAFVRWKASNFRDAAQVRLPSEREWEHAARSLIGQSEPEAFLDSARLYPQPAEKGASLGQMTGTLWQWTNSYYEPYPGYRPFDGALAEYNGKFMDNQRVLRGGSCVTPRDHYRPSYRNFWPASTRFQFTGIRMARTLEE